MHNEAKKNAKIKYGWGKSYLSYFFLFLIFLFCHLKNETKRLAKIRIQLTAGDVET